MSVAAVLLSGCETAPPPRIAQPAAAPKTIEPPYRWTQGNAPQAYKDMVAELGTKGLKPGEYVWASAIPTDGDTRIILDLLTQMAYVYRGDKLVGASTMSSARKGMITPLGFWSILEKRPFYRSKKYDNAPMPHSVFFSGGYAVHATYAIKRLGQPASHGCVRLHPDNAADFYQLVETFGPTNTSIVIVK